MKTACFWSVVGGMYFFMETGIHTSLNADIVNTCQRTQHGSLTTPREELLTSLCAEEIGTIKGVERYLSLTKTVFTANVANDTGGALFTNNLRALDIGCWKELTSFNHEGGIPDPFSTPIFTRLSPAGVITENTCPEQWIENSASHPDGGDVTATTPTGAKICRLGTTDCVNQNEIFVIEDHTSGQNLEPFSVHMLDAFGRPSFGINGGLISVTSENLQIDLGGQTLTNAASVVNFTDVRLQAMVNATYNLTLHFDQGTMPDTQILVKVRQCHLGEILIDGGQRCQLCSGGLYSWNASQMECSSCPEYSECKGSTVTPKNGFWHSTSRSIQIHRCVSLESCNGEGRSVALMEAAKDAHRRDAILKYTDNDAYPQCSEVRQACL